MEDLKYFCILPWVHLSVYQDGKVKPCCRAGDDATLGNASTDTLADIWNSTKMANLRKSMLNNISSSICSRCYEEESLGKSSYRMEENHRLSRFKNLSEETIADGRLPHFKLRDVGMRFSNICNFSCRTCRPNSSTAWYFDAKILSGYKKDYRTALRPFEEFNDLLSQIIPHKDTLEEFFFAGGEPLMDHWHAQLLDWFIENKVTQMKLCYSTNFSFVQKNNFAILEKWRLFKEVELVISVDGIDKRGEYIRKGQNWDLFKSELDLFRSNISKIPTVFYSIHCTVSLFNVFHFIDVLRLFTEEYGLNGYLIRIDGVTNPSIYNVNLLPESLKLKAQEKMQDYIIELSNSEIVAKEKLINQIKSIIHLMNTEAQKVNLLDFIKATDLLDKLRGEDFKHTFPELADI